MLDMNVVPEKAVEKNTSDMYFIAAMLLLLGLGLVTLFTCSASYANRVFDDSFYFIKRQLISSLSTDLFLNKIHHSSPISCKQE